MKYLKFFYLTFGALAISVTAHGASPQPVWKVDLKDYPDICLATDVEFVVSSSNKRFADSGNYSFNRWKKSGIFSQDLVPFHSIDNITIIQKDGGTSHIVKLTAEGTQYEGEFDFEICRSAESKYCLYAEAFRMECQFIDEQNRMTWGHGRTIQVLATPNDLPFNTDKSASVINSMQRLSQAEAVLYSEKIEVAQEERRAFENQAKLAKAAAEKLNKDIEEAARLRALTATQKKLREAPLGTELTCYSLDGIFVREQTIASVKYRCDLLEHIMAFDDIRGYGWAVVSDTRTPVMGPSYQKVQLVFKKISR